MLRPFGRVAWDPGFSDRIVARKLGSAIEKEVLLIEAGRSRTFRNNVGIWFAQ